MEHTFARRPSGYVPGKPFVPRINRFEGGVYSWMYRMARSVATLTPAQALDVAGTIRIQLASLFEGTLTGPIPGRGDLSRLRELIDLYVDELEMIAWGEPEGDVEIAGPRHLLEAIAHDLREGGEERVANPLGWNTEKPPLVRHRGRSMLAAAKAIERALGDDRALALA